MGLRKAEPQRDVCLRAVAEEEQEHDPALAIVEAPRSAGDGRAVDQRVFERGVRAGDVVVVQLHSRRLRGSPARRSHGRRAVPEVMADLPVDAPREVGGQLGAGRIASVDRAHERESSDLCEVFRPLAAAGVAPSHALGERQVRLDQAPPVVSGVDHSGIVITAEEN